LKKQGKEINQDNESQGKDKGKDLVALQGGQFVILCGI
jgi:hypothetical protein